jgi:hypothetical protein
MLIIPIEWERRGVLCNPCNNVLGDAKDNINILKAAITYLEINGYGYK